MFECFTSNLRAMRRWLVGRSGAALLEGAAPAAPRYPQRHGEGDYLADSGAAGAVRPKRRDSGKAWLCLCAVLLPSLAPAQLNTPVLPQPSIDPVAAGKTDTLLRLPDGKILVGSNTLQGFDRLGTASVADCARLAIDGSVDLSFQCAAGPVVEFATDSVGRIYVRTNFTVKRLLATGAIDPAFPTVSSDLSIVQMLIVDDQIYLSGVFTLINGQPRAHLARLNLSGTVDPGFNPQVDGSVFAMLAPGDSFLYVGGNFQTLAGQPRTRIGRLLLPGGTLDSWTVSITRSAGTPQVQTLAIDATHVYIGGIFDAVQGQSRSGLARVSRQASAALDTAWTARLIGEGVSTGLSLLTVVGEHLYLAIGFSRISLQSGTVSAIDRCLARVERNTGAVDSGFNPFADAIPGQRCVAGAVIAGDGGGRLFVGGDLERMSAGLLRFGLAALNANGSVDTLTALPEALKLATVNALAVDAASGSRYLQGDFRRINGVRREGLVRMLANGTIDSSFRPAPRRYTATALVDNKLFVADDDTRTLQRLDPLSGDPVAGFTPIPYNLSISHLHASATHVYLIGNFNLTAITPPLGRFARMNLASGSIDTNFRFAADTGTSILGVAADPASNSLFVHGSFNTLNGAAPARLARLDATTLTVDAGFNANIPTTVSRALVDDVGGMFISGGFTTVGGQSCRAPARLLLPSGARDPGFACNTNIGGSVMALAPDALFFATTTQIRRYARASGGVPDPNWRVSDMPQMVVGMHASERDLFVYGRFDHISGATRLSLAALPQLEQFGRNGFE